MAAPERFAETSDSFPLHRGRRPYMARKSPAVAPPEGSAYRDAADAHLRGAGPPPLTDAGIGLGQIPHCGEPLT
jgi:hypothetical protein